MSTWLLRGVARLVSLLSWKGAQSFGAFLGLVWFHLLRIRRGQVRHNLAYALPNRTDEHYRISRTVYRNMGISGIELFKMRSMSGEEILEKVRNHGLEQYEEALARGRGIIVVTGHFGNFDLLACSQALRGVKLAIVSRDLHGKGSNRFWMETRQSSGLTIFPDTGSAREILKWLRSGNVLGLVVDQRTGPSEGGIVSPFLGQDVWTSTAPAKLASRTGAALLPVRIERREDGDHDLFVEKEIEMQNGISTNDRVAQVTADINHVLEKWVQDLPASWMWLHKRFDRPDRCHVKSIDVDID
jgi:KDO2-lipid IV(A) lauroyltransferase